MKTYYWSRKPGLFVNKFNGVAIPFNQFTGTVYEWNETLLEVIMDLMTEENKLDFEIHVNTQVSTILSCSCLFSIDAQEQSCQYYVFIGGKRKFIIDDNIDKDTVVLKDTANAILGQVKILNMDIY